MAWLTANLYKSEPDVLNRKRYRVKVVSVKCRSCKECVCIVELFSFSDVRRKSVISA